MVQRYVYQGPRNPAKQIYEADYRNQNQDTSWNLDAVSCSDYNTKKAVNCVWIKSTG